MNKVEDLKIGKIYEHNAGRGWEKIIFLEILKDENKVKIDKTDKKYTKKEKTLILENGNFYTYGQVKFMIKSGRIRDYE